MNNVHKVFPGNIVRLFYSTTWLIVATTDEGFFALETDNETQRSKLRWIQCDNNTIQLYRDEELIY